MKQILEFIPLLLFFLFYKFYDIQIATIVLIVATISQLIIFKVLYKKIEKSQWIVAISVVVFGAFTVYFNDIRYLQWKVTVVYALFMLTLLISQFVFKKPIIKQLLGKEISLPEQVWSRLNFGWALFFFLCILLNLYATFFLSHDMWVDFKTFVFTGLSLVATLATGFYIYPHISKQEDK